jgi:hypothetical protein
MKMNELFESTKNIPQPIPLVSYGERRLVFQISIDLGLTVKLHLGEWSLVAGKPNCPVGLPALFCAIYKRLLLKRDFCCGQNKASDKSNYSSLYFNMSMVNMAPIWQNKSKN